jgi:hypothetical protein
MTGIGLNDRLEDCWIFLIFIDSLKINEKNKQTKKDPRNKSKG